jgi:hypothetical protein
MYEIKSPNQIILGSKYTIFLGGSIEMGTAENWQTRLTKELAEYDVVLLNPRRDDWDSSWIQSIHNAQFKEQVTWELDAMDCADLIVFYFDPSTKSPITLIELGLFATLSNVIVCCPDGFWRKGNVEIVCERYDVPLCNTFDELVSMTKTFIKDQK